MSEAIETAKVHIAQAEREQDPVGAALVGIGFALIGIGEALEGRQGADDEVLEVSSSGEPWSGVQAALAEFERLVPFISKRIEYRDVPGGGSGEGVLVHVGLPELVDTLHGINTAVTAAVMRENSRDPIVCPSTCIVGPAPVDRTRVQWGQVGGTPDNCCNECKQRVGNYHLSSCSKNPEG